MRAIVQTAALILVLLMGGCSESEQEQVASGYPLTPTVVASENVDSPTATPTAIPAPTATPTAIPAPTATPTPIPTVTPTPTRVASSNPASYPPFPNIYGGAVIIGGLPAKDGVAIYGRMGNYRTPDVFTKDGKYSSLVIGPPDASYIGARIIFIANVDGADIAAAEVAYFGEASIAPPFTYLNNSLNLVFP